MQALSVAECFDERYRDEPRYWWRHPNRYSADPLEYRYSLVTQMTLRLIRGQLPGRALDLGAGEGADSIRLAMMGYEVTAVEISKVGAEKIRNFALEAGVQVRVDLADVSSYQPDQAFDLVICNGLLHYVADKEHVVSMMQNATRPGGLNVISVWSTFTAVPDCHKNIPVFPDAEDGEDAIVLRMYRTWREEFLYLDRNKIETAHDEMTEHSHSHIKMIARKPG